MHKLWFSWHLNHATDQMCTCLRWKQRTPFIYSLRSRRITVYRLFEATEYPPVEISSKCLPSSSTVQTARSVREETVCWNMVDSGGSWASFEFFDGKKPAPPPSFFCWNTLHCYPSDAAGLVSLLSAKHATKHGLLALNSSLLEKSVSKLSEMFFATV